MQNKKIKPIKRPWHDCGSFFISTIEPDINEPIKILIRTEKDNVTKCFVEISHDGKNFYSFPLTFSHNDSTNNYEYFKGEIPGQSEMFKYRFRLENDNPKNTVYYSRTHFGKKAPEFDETKLQADDLWCIIPGYHTPDWAKGVIWYSVMPDAFYNGDTTNDEPISGANYSNPWNIVQHTLGYKYGGDLKGIEKKLKYIKDLGCEAVFMNPIFKSSQNAGYGPEFYKQIENSFGNAQSLSDLAKAVHQNGMHYMIDVVFAFVALRDIWFNHGKTNPLPGAAQNWENEYHDYFFFDGKEGDLNGYRGKWGGAELNHANEDLCNKIYKDNDSYLQYYCSSPFDVDAMRFDCGGDLYGVYPDGTQIKDWQVVEKMRPILKKINPELMMLSEYSMYYSVEKGAWDSRWQLQFANYAVPYMKGQMTESEIFASVNMESLNLPRAFALCQYTSIADHDRPRTLGVERWAFKAYQLLQMTSVCAPCIYYGDEIKNERERGTFYAMEWDESKWNYEYLHDVKALTSLRKQVSAIRLGAFKCLCIDNDRHILSFARMDEKSLSVTITNKNPFSQKFTLNTLDLEQPDGTLFTDWVTGKQYVSQNGTITVDIIPGGTVLVKGDLSSDYRDFLAITKIGENDSEVTLLDSHSLQLKGTGKFSNKDNLTFVNTHLFGTCRISANVAAKGAAVLMLRADTKAESPFVCIKIQGKNLSIYKKVHTSGNIKFVKSVPYNFGQVVELSRDEKNNFTVTLSDCGMASTYEVDDEFNTMLSGKTVVADNIHADCPNHILGGFSVLRGKAVFESIRINSCKEAIKYDNFKNGYSAMFDKSEGTTVKYTKNALQIWSDNKAELLTNSPDEDWTFKSCIKSLNQCEGEYCGIISRQDDENAVIAGRMILDGKNILFLGKESDGKLAVLQTVPDTNSDRSLIIQLQRIGTAYSAVYSHNEKKYGMIGSHIIANLCKERVGLITESKKGAIFKWASFGNAINDNETINTPVTPKNIITDYSDMNNVLLQPAYEIVNGQWDYANEGYIQKDINGGQMGINNKYFTSFKADGTYLFDKGDGFIALEFGKKTFNTPLGDGVSIVIDTLGTVKVVVGGKELASAKIPFKLGVSQRICADYQAGTLVIYEGQSGKPVLILRNFVISKGYFSYYTKGVLAHVNNSLIASLDSPFNFAAEYELPNFENKKVTKCWHHNHAFINQTGIAVSNFETSADFTPKFFSSSPDGYVGFYITSPEGKFTDSNTLKVVLNQYNQVCLKKGETILASGRAEDKPDGSVNIRIVKVKNTVKIFVNGGENAIIDYTLSNAGGGVVSLCANKAVCEFGNWKLKDLTPRINSK